MVPIFLSSDKYIMDIDKKLRIAKSDLRMKQHYTTIIISPAESNAIFHSNNNRNIVKLEKLIRNLEKKKKESR